MTIRNYNGLVASIGEYLGDDTLTDVIPQFIDICESRINSRVRLRAQETFFNETITAGDTTIDLPTYFRGMRSVFIVGTPNYRLEYMTPEQLNDMSNTAGRPKVFTIRGEKMLFPGASDATYVVRVHYWGIITPISSTNTTNWFTINHPHVLLYGSLQAAAEYISDDEAAAKWGALFSQALNEIQEQDRIETYGPAPVMRTEGARW